MRNAVCILSALLLTAAAHAGVRGTVRASSGVPLSNAQVLAQSESSGMRWKTLTDEEGRYTLAALPPGRFKVTARLPGFRTVTRIELVLDSSDATELDFRMELIALHEIINVTGTDADIDPSSGSTLLLIRDGKGAAVPSNGRDFRSSFDMMPGVAVVPAAVSDAGQFTSNGQRPNSNTFRVDGVNVNSGVGGSSLPGSFPGASLPAMTALGTTENLASPENTQSVELRTSGFAPEFGERTGAESFVITRSGSNEFHGSLSGYWRDSSWNARDWFANSRGLATPRSSYRNTGATVGGPVWRNRTFFFASAEHSEVNDRGLQLTVVPSLDARRSAPLDLRRVMSGFPLPSGPNFNANQAEGLAPLGRTGTSSSFSLRIDQSLGSRGTVFTRLSYSPSSSLSEYMNASYGEFNWLSATFGATLDGSAGTVHDLRFNYSHSAFSSRFQGGAAFDYAFGLGNTFNLPLIAPSLSSGPDYTYYTYAMGLSVPGFGQFVSGGHGGNRQSQFEVRDTISLDAERHQFRAGVDYSRLRLFRDGQIGSLLGFAQDFQSFMAGRPLAIVYSAVPSDAAAIDTVSVFGQDTFRIGRALTLVYGLRWEITPPTSNRLQIPTVSGLWSGTDWLTRYTGDISGAAPWPMRYGQIAPRLGLAYRLPGGGLVIRAGAGVFFDTRLGSTINPANGGPFNTWQLPTGGTGVGTGGGSRMAGMPFQDERAADVAQFLQGPDTALRLPRSTQWRVSLEKGLGPQRVASLSYLGAQGSHLLGNQAYIEADSGTLRRRTAVSRNSSNYQALQLRYAGSLGQSVYASASYTWSHSLDNGSLDSSMFLIHPGYRLEDAWASSNFDLRQALTSTLSFRMPHSLRSKSVPDWLMGWNLSGILRLRGGFPINIANVEPAFGRNYDNAGRPDLVAGVPIWIEHSSLAGGRRLNPAAFADPSSGRNGTLGRNAISGNGLAQWDANLRREFALPRHLSLQLGLNVFNVLNRPSFADPVPFRSSPLFGQATSLQNLMLGLGTPNGGLPALFQSGGTRSVEFNLRFSF